MFDVKKSFELHSTQLLNGLLGFEKQSKRIWLDVVKSHYLTIETPMNLPPFTAVSHF